MSGGDPGVRDNNASRSQQFEGPKAPSLNLPKGGGAIRGMGEKFTTNPANGSAMLSVPIRTSPARGGFDPKLSLAYDSASGNGLFGLGWSLSVPMVSRSTDKRLPTYEDANAGDVFLLSGSEELVPVLLSAGDQWSTDTVDRTVAGVGYRVARFRPRIEGLFARVERWTAHGSGEIHWRSISNDNVTTLYGTTPSSRIADSSDPRRVFSWLACETFDDKGNAIRYDYVAEDSSGIDASRPEEQNRTPSTRSANRYLKRILYGNRTPRQPDEELRRRSDWMFEVIFDYGEGHYVERPSDPDGRRIVVATPVAAGSWARRTDPFSHYKTGFEIRTYRLCQRVLVFHHFPTELGAEDYLVRALHCHYNEGPVLSFATSFVEASYRRRADGTYIEDSQPPLELTYSSAQIQASVHDVDPRSLEGLAEGVDGTQHRWIDLDGEGVSGVLSNVDSGWRYKANLGEGVLALSTLVGTQPTLSTAADSHYQFIDLRGDGELCLVSFARAGFHRRASDGTWDSFVPFRSWPTTLSVDDPNLRFLDLTGDGRADALVSRDNGWSWHPSLADDGFDVERPLVHVTDEEIGPRLLFSDPLSSIHLADMTGDGQLDIVRIRNGEVCYWPNLGRGRFGARVMMSGSPWFDSPEVFDERRIRLADIDGSGVADLLYLAADGVRIYINEAGNGWGRAKTLSPSVPIDNAVHVTVTDFLGNGTACLVWSSPLSADLGRAMRYIDLMGGEKPHLLVGVTNNRGTETRIQYAPSTRFYLADKAAGRPWVTRLAFPVQLVERVEVYDRIGKTRFVTRSAYHHGYYDTVEREFRGFGMVEQWDTEELGVLDGDDAHSAASTDAASYSPPVLRKTWFHTGIADPEGQTVSGTFAHEYYREGDSSLGDDGLDDTQASALLLDDTVLPSIDTVDDMREACRALRGSMLRQEIYAVDGAEAQDRPYLVTERNYTVRVVQPRGPNEHGCFYAHSRETVELRYERRLYTIDGHLRADPRVTHSLTFEVDDVGNVTKAATVAYGRRYREADPRLSDADRDAQRRLLVGYVEDEYTNGISEADAHRAPQVAQKSNYDIYGLVPDATDPHVTNLFGFAELFAKLQALSDGAHELPFEDYAGTGRLARRLAERSRHLYRSGDLATSLPVGQLDASGLFFQAYTLCFTPSLLQHVYGDRLDQIALTQGGYVDLDGDGHAWAPTGRAFYSERASDSTADELAQARAHFFTPVRFVDPFGAATTIRYDSYDLLVVQVEDALGGTLTAGEVNATGVITPFNDYRVLLPSRVTDANGNRSEVAYDIFGQVTGTAVMGKRGDVVGDSLDGFVADLSRSELDLFFAAPRQRATALLGNATTRVVPDLAAYQRSGAPVYNATIARETHVSDLAAGSVTKVQICFSFSDGFEREIQKKLQAEEGPVVDGGPVVAPRWVGSGWTIFNNKAKPVRQYEPFFSDNHKLTLGAKQGVSPILLYDPLQRVAATVSADHTYFKTIVDGWRTEAWDGIDNVLRDDPSTDPDVGPMFLRLPAADYLPTWYAARINGALGPDELDAAKKSAALANTPTVAFFDPLGRGLIAISDNADAGLRITRVTHDLTGNQREVTDAEGRTLEHADFDMCGNRIAHATMDGGTRTTLHDVFRKPIRAWDARGTSRAITYDALHRATELHVQADGADRILLERKDYGDSPGTGLSSEQITAGNLRGRLWRHCDSAGVLTHDAYDFKGNLLRSTRQLVVDYRRLPDWTGAPELEQARYTSSTRFDGLNRVAQVISPHDSGRIHVVQPIYNEANLLEELDAWFDLPAEPTSLVVSTPDQRVVSQLDYDAKGRRKSVLFGSGASTVYTYDLITMRLRGFTTTRAHDQRLLQDLRYTHDACGHITTLRDQAQQTIYFNNAVVDAVATYSYDALYQLVEATGREHIGQTTEPVGFDDSPRTSRPHPSDGAAMRQYTERYRYDEVGNLLALVHSAGNNQWTREHIYSESSAIHPAQVCNRLTSSTAGSVVEQFAYDAAGNITRMAHLTELAWDHEDRLQRVELGGGGTCWMSYDSDGERVRKVTERLGGVVEERIYLGHFEIFRRSSGGSVTLERETVHLMDQKQRVALVELRTQGDDGTPARLVRYQHGNHLGSVLLELDDTGAVVSYEEYYPFGSTAYQAVHSQVGVPKRYRYSAKERDEETGLYYYGARYYAPWLSRWLSCDPAGLTEGVDPYVFSRNDPVNFRDPDGNVAVASINGEVGELFAQQALEMNGLIVFPNWSKHVNAKGFDFIAYDPQTKKIWFVDNKAYTGTISEVSSLSPANYATNVEEAKTFLQSQTGKEASAALTALEREGGAGVERVVMNAYSAGNAGFSEKIFAAGIKAFDVRLGTLFGSRQAWISEMTKQGLLTGRRFASKMRIKMASRGFATVEGMLVALVVVGTTVYVMRYTDKATKQMLAGVATDLAINGAMYKVFGGVGSMCIDMAFNLCSDSPYIQREECERKPMVMAFLRKYAPQTITRSSWGIETADPVAFQEAYDFLFNTEPIVLPAPPPPPPPQDDWQKGRGGRDGLY